MSEVNKELVSLGKIEGAKMLTQEEIDNRIINKIEDMKYGFLELGGYLKISREIYFRDTIDIYNDMKGTNIKYEEVESMANYTGETNRNFKVYCKNTYGLSRGYVDKLINVYINYDEDRIKSMSENLRGLDTLNRLTSVEDEYFMAEDFLNLKAGEHAKASDVKNKDLTYDEIRKSITEHNRLDREYNRLDKEAKEEGISAGEKVKKNQKELSNDLYNELIRLRNFKKRYETEKEDMLNKAMSEAVESYEIQEKALMQKAEKLKAQYGNIEQARLEIEKQKEELFDLENELLEQQRNLPKVDDVKKERDEIQSQITNLLIEKSNLSNEIVMLNNKKLEATNTIEKLEEDLKELAPFRDKMQFLYKNIKLITDIQDRLKEVMSQDYSELLKYEDIKELYLLTLDNLINTVSDVYAKFGEGNRVIQFERNNIIEQ